MTKKHFKIVADAMNSVCPVLSGDGDYDQWLEAVTTLAAAFAKENIRFDSAKFLNACGVRT